MQERIERADASVDRAIGPREHGRHHLRQRLEQLADGHPSSDHYPDAIVSRRDGSPGTSRTDTNREDVTGSDTSREETTGTNSRIWR